MSLRTLRLTRNFTTLTPSLSPAARRLSTTARIMTSLPTQQRAWTLANPPTGPVQADTFKLETRPLPALEDDSVLLRIDYLSNDPAQRNWIAKDSGSVKQGDVFKANALATVVKSNSPKWKEGQVVIGYFGWVDYAVVPAASIQREAPQLPGRPAIALGMLGSTGATAYHGIMDILDIKPEHTVVVSGAAGYVLVCRSTLTPGPLARPPSSSPRRSAAPPRSSASQVGPRRSSLSRASAPTSVSTTSRPRSPRTCAMPSAPTAPTGTTRTSGARCSTR